MALKDIYNLAVADSVHRATVGGAIIKAANDILNEAGGVANHANRALWAQAVLDNPAQQQSRIFRYVLNNPAVLAYFLANQSAGGNDDDVQFVINGIVSDATLLTRIQAGGG